MQTVLHTNGTGLWSNAKKSVRIIDMQLGYVDDQGTFGELCVYFDTADWDVSRDGLIYTDRLFKQQLNTYLAQQGLGRAEYSEQGMQGDTYVSCDVGAEFLVLWFTKFNTMAA